MKINRRRFGGEPADLPQPGGGAGPPRGMVLMMALVVLLLMSLMGMAILSNTRTEMSISANTTGGRDAFTRADSASRIATLLARLVVHEHELGAPYKVMTAAGPFTVDLNAGDGYVHNNSNLTPLNMVTLLAESAENFDYQRRYLSATARSDISRPELRPHAVFRQDDKVVATARIDLDYDESFLDGGSLGSGSYDDSGGTTKARVVLAVTVHGHPPIDATDDEGKYLDDYGAYDGSRTDDEGAINDVPHSVVTTMFRETF